jgi:two-component sensor histidine kinase
MVPDSRLDALEAAMGDRTRALEAALEQRTALLNELDHRVKNNLQLISSLMLMQARRTADPAVRAALEAMLGRLHAIATVHRRLFDRDDLGRFDLSEFVRDLVSDLVGARDGPTSFACELSPAPQPVRLAGSLALAINELVAEALVRAAGGSVRIAIHVDDSGVRIEIADDVPCGAGPGVGETPADPGGDLGGTIVDLLVRQLHGRLRRDSGPKGTRVELVLPSDQAEAGR